MSERKVLNKYYPPEFDPSKIPKLRQKKTGVFSIRIMSPFNMRCNTCGEYIYKGKKFNSRKENVDDDDYLGLRIFRFYIRCPRCIAEIAFKTDLANTDYTLEAGATRLFEAEKLAHQMAEKERKEKEEDELNPMKMLENRTKASRNEMEQLDQLDELREINARNARLDHNVMLEKHIAYEEQLLKLQEEEEDSLVKAIMRKGNASGPVIKRIKDDDDEEDGDEDGHGSKGSSIKRMKSDAMPPSSGKSSESSFAQDPPTSKKEEKKESWQLSVGSFSSKKSFLSGLVKKKTPASKASTTSQTLTASTVTISKATSAQASASNGAGLTVIEGDNDNKTMVSKTTAGVTGLGLLGGYSDSEEDSS